ncbi:MAG TPA: ATP-binding protein [Candidatus Dormibacteraeota bacterium]|nr:ATP-binding protein [Candidatus Dormibacteraeota bacterium]
MPRPVALIVNDDPSQLRLSAVVLEKGGFAARTCTSAEDALALLAESPKVDLIVTDLHMPGIDGWRFCRLLRSPEFPSCNAIPILVVSATFSGSEAELRSLELGASGFLAAPFAPSALQDYARALLSGRRPEPAPQVVIAHADPLEADRLRGAFVEAGYEVDCAATAAEALATWRALQPELVVVDDHLPDRPAAELLATLAAPGSSTVAIAIVDPAAAGEAVKLARQGADATVVAPADPARLVELAATARRQRSMMRIEERLDERSRALRDSEARWRSLVEAIPEIVIIHDADGIIRHVNRIGAAHLGWPEDECVGRHLDEVERAAGGGGDPGAPFEAIWMSRGGRETPVEVVRRPLRFDGREGFLSIARDISARQELARQRQDFLAMLTHDIKNPLGVVLGFAELLGEVGPLNEEQRDLVARIQANAGAVLTLVANYLNLSQIEAGQLTIVRKPVDLATLIEGVMHRFRAAAARDGIACETEIKEPLGVLAADPVALERVLTNLVHNALKFTPPGGRVSVRAQRTAESVTLQVSDTGVGIAPEELESVFQPYRRGMTRQAREGTGLGLFIARALISGHGGRISIASTVGEGTTVTISLPVGAPAGERRADP